MFNHWTIVPVVVLLFLGANLAIGLLAGRGHVKSTAEHVVGGRNLGFLLVFFMMASLAMSVHGGIPVNLPKAARAEAARAPVSVSISREGIIYLEREQVDPAQFSARLQARARTEPDAV